ncbi:hypothetical protein FB470_006894 [Amycolatopsis thermophila]|uniref:Uncharacterized protein n=1 Tax=Amycolatopsis thermophila TaxID=206084 RepID=A0ABU0F782_9PSEU|nr:hypothetical protein [Amycolatopsis thermophila]
MAELARLGYDAKLFRSMLAQHGPVEAARRLVLARDPSDGLWRLKTLLEPVLSWIEAKTVSVPRHTRSEPLIFHRPR